jgi:tripartite-type tricarboxylate transporter receptor subunit TctC
MPFIAAGKLRAVAVTGKERLSSLPDVPTATQAGLPNLDAGSWFAVFAPAKVPQAVVDKLTTEIQKIMATPEFKKKAAELGATADYMNPQQLQAHSDAEFLRWGKVISSAKIQAD